MANQSKNNPFFSDPLADRHRETSENKEKEPAKGVKSHDQLAKIMEYSAQVTREQEQKKKDAASVHNPAHDAITRPDKQQSESS